MVSETLLEKKKLLYELKFVSCEIVIFFNIFGFILFIYSRAISWVVQEKH